MKFNLLTTALLFCLSSYAQHFPNPELGSQAVFTACINEENPFECTKLTFENMITKLITPKIVEEIKNSSHKDALDVAILFISDEQGKVIKEDIEILCENNDLQASIRNLISHLPAFYPKSQKLKIRKSAHFYNLTFIPDTEYKNYTLAPDLYTSRQISYDRFATFKGCKEEKKDSYECLYNTISSTVNNNMVIPKSYFISSDRLIVSFFVNTDGNVIITKITGGNEELRNNVKMAFRKVPTVEPAVIKNIPVIQSFKLPITINVK